MKYGFKMCMRVCELVSLSAVAHSTHTHHAQLWGGGWVRTDFFGANAHTVVCLWCKLDLILIVSSRGYFRTEEFSSQSRTH